MYIVPHNAPAERAAITPRMPVPPGACVDEATASSVAPMNMTAAPPHTPSQRAGPASRSSLKSSVPQRIPNRLFAFHSGNAIDSPMSLIAKIVSVLATAQRQPASTAQITRCGAWRTSSRTALVPRSKAGTLQRAVNTPSTIIKEITTGEMPRVTSLVGASAAPSHAPAANPESMPTRCSRRSRTGSSSVMRSRPARRGRLPGRRRESRTARLRAERASGTCRALPRPVRQPSGIALLRQHAFGEIHALRQLAQLALHRVHLFDDVAQLPLADFGKPRSRARCALGDIPVAQRQLVDVAEFAGQNDDHVVQPPHPEAAERQRLRHPAGDAADIEAMEPEHPAQASQDQRDGARALRDLGNLHTLGLVLFALIRHRQAASPAHTIASASISTSIAGSTKPDTCTMVLAGRIAPKISPCARPTSCHCLMSATKTRVRTTSRTVAPALTNARSMLRNACIVCT